MEGNDSGQRVVGEGLSERSDAEGPAKGAEQASQAGETSECHGPDTEQGEGWGGWSSGGEGEGKKWGS